MVAQLANHAIHIFVIRDHRTAIAKTSEVLLNNKARACGVAELTDLEPIAPRSDTLRVVFNHKQAVPVGDFAALPAPLEVTQDKFSQDSHPQKGLTCTSCHGGDATSYDPTVSMGKKAGFKGKIDRKQIPQLCGSCHSNPTYIKQYDPGLRTDQLDQYHTSMHGKRLAAG